MNPVRSTTGVERHGPVTDRHLTGEESFFPCGFKTGVELVRPDLRLAFLCEVSAATPVASAVAALAQQEQGQGQEEQQQHK